MYSNVFPRTPAPSSEINKSDQQQVHYNLLNFNNTAASGLIAPKPIQISSTSSQQQISADKPSFLREKNLNQLYDIEKTRKRLSDSILAHRPPLSTKFLFPKHVPHESQKIFIIRHGERVDSTFGSNWLEEVFDKTTGVYRRTNLNLPKKMVTRKDFKDFLLDPPLTELGLHQGKIVGEELANQGIKIDYVYSSPTLRCIQTADKILEGLKMREKISIRIEPCLFEFLKWYPVIPVTWPFLDLDELIENGYNIDKTYKQFYPIESLRTDENELMFYMRSHLIITSILKNHQIDEGNLLIVGHVNIKKNNFYSHK
jgi:broad specificity phosphatase PhoE